MYKKTKDIYEFMIKNLSKLGFKIESDFSGISDSCYIKLKNFEQITGKSSKWNDDNFIIRLSNHDLPPSYEGKYGYYDMDIKTENKKRYGTEGLAEDYDTAIKYIYDLVNKPYPIHIQNLDRKDKEEKEKFKKDKEVSINNLQDALENTFNQTVNQMAYNIILEYLKDYDKKAYREYKNLMEDLTSKGYLSGNSKQRKKGRDKLKYFLKTYAYENLI